MGQEKKINFLIDSILQHHVFYGKVRLYMIGKFLTLCYAKNFSVKKVKEIL
jgi:hypothetical protein